MDRKESVCAMSKAKSKDTRQSDATDKNEGPDINEFLRITSEELHRPARKTFRKSRIHVNGAFKIWSCDLAEFAEADENARFVLVAVDAGTRLAYATPLKNKSAEEVAAGFKRLFKEARAESVRRPGGEHPTGKPEKIWVDQGKEFWNKEVQKIVETYSSFGDSKSVLAERFIRTLRDKVWRKFDALNTRDLAKLLPEIIKEYNGRVRSAPARRKAYDEQKDKYKAIQVFEIGDMVRISRIKGKFEKEAYANWSRELFTITQAAYYPKDNLWKYKVKDYNGEEIKGEFYQEELQKSQLTENIFLVEKVLQRRKGKALVKWLGYDEKFNSWIPEEDIVQHLDEPSAFGDRDSSKELKEKPVKKPIEREERKRPRRDTLQPEKEESKEKSKEESKEEVAPAVRRSARVAAKKK